ncbi:universal stress protein [Ramlibacter pallidus]|uniref:Universal stress protein n=1 Tax=Ramlibacter pallidus TaxID=2780087 RepID=A0ABR9RXS7_9BURK|nr:universal stress protein [Ramlibacter pallidus]MBE7366054.1 universal stress protein [Ramlibacter pallidus]
MFKRILVPVDGSDTSLHALQTAGRLARENGGQLRLVHVMDRTAYLTGYDPSGGGSGALYEALRGSGRQILADSLAAAQAAGATADTLMVDELGLRLGDAVARAAADWQADLIVVGTHGRSGPSRLLLGSGAEQVIRLAPVPVLVTRG